MIRALKIFGLALLYLSCILVTVIIFFQLKLYYSENQVAPRADIDRLNNADITAEVEQALAAGEYGFIGFTTGWGTTLNGVYCSGIEYQDIDWRRYVGQGDVIYSRAYQSASTYYARAYNRALVSHPESPYKSLCGMKATRCGWDESDGGLRGCETVKLPIN